jgi:CDP-diacylglycerol--glycerol-3-phosphate 3-phosphatidyltransferase
MAFIEQKARDLSRPTLEAIGRMLAKWNVSPNAVTYLGLVLTVGVAALAAVGEIRWAGLAYIFAAVFDAMDGTLARISGKTSRFGAFLDSTIDRFEESIVFLGLTIYYAQVGGLIELPLILLATVSSLMVSYTRARAEAVGVECKVGFMGRPPRVAVMIVGMVLDQVLIALILIALTSLFTAFHRMYHVWQMTGGEAGGWGPAKKPFVLPIPAGPTGDNAPSETPGESQGPNHISSEIPGESQEPNHTS